MVNWLLNTGDQVPEIPLSEVMGNVKLPPGQSEFEKEKLGTVAGTTAIIFWIVNGQPAEAFNLFGVKV